MEKKDWRPLLISVSLMMTYALVIGFVYIFVSREPLGFFFLVSTFIMLAMLVARFALEAKRTDISSENRTSLGYYSPGSLQPLILGISISVMAFLFTFNIWFFIYSVPIFVYIVKSFFKEAKH